MPEAKRPESKRRSPASRPGKAGDSVRGGRATKPSAKPSTPAPHASRKTTRTPHEHIVEPIKRAITESVEKRSEQRLGFTARRAAILAAVVCVLTLTIARPVRTYFAQRAEMEQLAATEAMLRRQIADLEEQQVKLADPAYIAAQARERLGFVMPGDIPFQVQLPSTPLAPPQPGSDAATATNNEPWYTALWHTIADDLESARWVTRAAEWDRRVYAAVALHPTRADALTDAARAELERLVAHPRVVAVGETGIDMYWPGRLDGCAEPHVQREAFAWHIDLAKRTGKPLMIHNRQADRDVLDVLRAEGAPDTVILHCFSSDAAMARTCVDAGWLLSLSGTVSFRNARELREAVPLMPVEQLLVETDAPYLTPHPHRGLANEPYCLPYTVRALAELVNRRPEEVALITTSNARRAYGLGWMRQ